MDLLKAMRERHSVRSYNDTPITGKTLGSLKALVDRANADSGLHIQLVLNEPEAFGGRIARYGSFKGVRNYIALVGRDDKELEPKCGYFGERIVIGAQALGLNTCWVGLNYSKVPDAYVVGDSEKLLMVIAIGYGENIGKPHRSKTPAQVIKGSANAPKWFTDGVEAALLAPTALNQQKFTFELIGDKVLAKAKWGPYSKTDLGIVKYHFELASGKGPDVWE